MSETEEKRPMAKEFEGEKLPYPAKQSEMKRQPTAIYRIIKRREINGKVALITGADSESVAQWRLPLRWKGARCDCL
jgi:hypothetical protein